MKAFTTTLLALLCLSLAASNKPNIVFIMADDLGLGDISHYWENLESSKALVKTPSMDALAEAGMWFTDAHSPTALCSPTRYCVMSGNYNYRSYAPWGVWGTFRESAIDKGEATLGRVATKAGYSTAFIGKWHLGGDFADKKTGQPYRGNDRGDPNTTVDASKYIDNGPGALGFEYSFNIPCGIQGPIYLAYENDVWYPLATDSEIIYLDEASALEPEIVSDKGPGLGDSNWDTREIGKILSEKAVDFINRESVEEPFFLYYCSPMVHVPHMPPASFDGLKIADTTPSPHLDMLKDLDQQVNRIVKALKANKVYDNTLIILSSDNGGLGISSKTNSAGHDSSGEWRGFKNAPHEGGHRVPFIAVWDGVIQPGTISDEPVINMDVLATMAEMMNVEIPKDQAMDSKSLLPLLTSDQPYESRPYIILQAGSKLQTIYRQDGWKLIMQSDSNCTKFEPIELYNLDSNPYEEASRNLVDHPEQRARVKNMHNRYLHIRNSGMRTVP
ncbi:MAG: arylsulfatase [Puniceicoccaceae bacterium]